MIKKITYHITHNSGSNYLVYADEKELSGMGIPDDIILEISSFGLTVTEHFGTIAVEDDVAHRLKSIYEQNWNFNLGLPIFTFEGQVEKFDPAFIEQPVVIFFTTKKVDHDWICQMYAQALSLLPKKQFVAYESKDLFSSLTSRDQIAIQSWIKTYRRKLLHINEHSASNSVKYNIEKRHCDWYPDKKFRTELLEAAKSKLNDFVYATSFNIFIPNFMVIPAFHAYRHKQALEILNYCFAPVQVMPLPVRFRNDEYTLLFPICKPLTRANFKAKAIPRRTDKNESANRSVNKTNQSQRRTRTNQSSSS